MFSNPQKAKSCDKKLLRMSQNLKKTGKCSHDLFQKEKSEAVASEGGRCLAAVSSDIFKQAGV